MAENIFSKYNGWYYCADNNFQLTSYPDTPIDLKLLIDDKYWILFGHNGNFVDIYDFNLNYIGYWFNEDLKDFYKHFITLAEFREKRIDEILND